jgi:hypothetical protein
LSRIAEASRRRGNGISAIASENDSTFAVRNTAKGSKNQTIPGAIKSLFKAATKEITRRQEDEPAAARRRRRGETGRVFANAKALFRRSVKLPAQAYVAATFLADTFEWLNYWSQDNDVDTDTDANFNATQEHLSPRL